MNSKNSKISKGLVEVEVSKKHEHFLTKTFPKILEEEVNKRLSNSSSTKKQYKKK